MRGLGYAALISALTVCCLAQSGPTPKLALDGARPIVYIAFDHIGARPTVEGDEPNRGLWLRLVNNSVVPIEVQTMTTSTKPELTLVPDEIVGRWIRISESDEPEPKEPPGYGTPPGSPELIQPGKSLLFSVPVTHVSRSWYMRVPFRLHLPPIKHGIQPLSYAEFTLEDLPENLLRKVHE